MCRWLARASARRRKGCRRSSQGSRRPPADDISVHSTVFDTDLGDDEGRLVRVLSGGELCGFVDGGDVSVALWHGCAPRG